MGCIYFPSISFNYVWTVEIECLKTIDVDERSDKFVVKIGQNECHKMFKIIAVVGGVDLFMSILNNWAIGLLTAQPGTVFFNHKHFLAI